MLVRRDALPRSNERVKRTWRTTSCIVPVISALCGFATIGCGNDPSVRPHISKVDVKSFANKVTREDLQSNASKYNTWLYLLIDSITPHNDYAYRGDKAKFNVRAIILDVLQPGTDSNSTQHTVVFRGGSTVTFVLDSLDTYDRKIDLPVPGTKTVWAINWWRIDTGVLHIDELWEPFSNCTNEELATVKQMIKKVSKTENLDLHNALTRSTGTSLKSH